jgi:glycosyltransferase involved in cell wall biosynthesis
VKGAAYYTARNSINTYHKRFLSPPKSAFASAKKVIAATDGVKTEIKKWYGIDSVVVSEIGIDRIRRSVNPRAKGDPIRLIWSGLHLPGKALNIVLYALADLPENLDWTLDVLGNGPMYRPWRRKCQKLGLANRCQWHGWLEKSEAVERMAKGHLFLLSSIADLTSTVLIEALSVGLPVICIDHCGFSSVVDETCGIKIPVGRPSTIVRGFRDGIEFLAVREEFREKLARGALEKSRAFQWKHKGQIIDAIYRSVADSYGNEMRKGPN